TRLPGACKRKWGMFGSAKCRIVILTAALALAGCRTEQQRREPPPFKPPYSSLPASQATRLAAESVAPARSDAAVQPAAALQPIPPPETAPPPFPPPAETI